MKKEQGWRGLFSTKVIPVHRTGWRGVWDALVSAVTGQPRLTSDQEFTMSVAVKGDADVKIDLTSESLTENENNR